MDTHGAPKSRAFRRRRGIAVLSCAAAVLLSWWYYPSLIKWWHLEAELNGHPGQVNAIAFSGDEGGSEKIGKGVRNRCLIMVPDTFLGLVAGKNVSAAEKARLLAEGASKVNGVMFNRLPDIPGAEAVFKGAPRATDAKSPILVVLKDGRIFRGFDDALIPDPSGATSGLRILLSKLGELK